MFHLSQYRAFKWFALLAVYIVTTACATTVTVNPATKDDLSKIKSVAIVPADVVVGLNKFASDDERLTEKEDENRPHIQNFCEDSIKNQGYDLVEFDFETQMEADDDFAYLLSQFKEDLGVAMQDPSVWNPVGDSARNLASEIGVDALLFVNYQGIRKSGGEVAKDIGTSILIGVLSAGTYVPVSAKDAGLAQVFLVDGISSDVLWKNSAMGREDPIVVKNALSNLPAKLVEPL